MAQKRPKLPRKRLVPVSAQVLLQDRLARDAFEALTVKRGVDKEKLLSLLARIPHAPDTRLPLVDRMNDRSVRKLPDQIRTWADTVQRVNASPWLGPDFLRGHAPSARALEIYPRPLNRILTPELIEPAARMFHEMPTNLRLYAGCLEGVIQFFHPTGHRRREIGYQPIRLRKWLTLQLLRLVRDAAKKPRYREVATLLNRAYEVAGDSRTYTEDNLIKLEKNNSWLVWLIREDSL
jgi:hypothetical protein